MTRIQTRREPPATGPDRTDIFSLLGDEVMPDFPTLEALLDRIEHREVRK